jgi:iron complex transport system substrate-binding protein
MRKKMRIVSLLPGATEVVAALGLVDEIVGVSHECDFPEGIQTKPVMVRSVIEPDSTSSVEIDAEVKAASGTHQSLYRLDDASLHRAEPDLIITQDLCHVCAVTPPDLQRALKALPQVPRLLTLNPLGLDDTLTDVERIGEAIGKSLEAKQLTSTLRNRLASIGEQTASARPRPRVACLEWLDPLYVAGHWVPEMVRLAGGTPVLSEPGAPSRRVLPEDVLAAAPDVVVLMPCGFTIERTRRELPSVTDTSWWRQLPAVRHRRVFMVDATSYFSRPGPRLIDGVGILAALCHADRFGHTVPRGAIAIPEA